MRAKGHFRNFRRRLMSAVSRKETEVAEVSLGAGWVRQLLRQMYDKQQRALLVTKNAVDLLRQLQVYCDAVALCTADALLDCPEAADIRQTVAEIAAAVKTGQITAESAEAAVQAAGELPFILRGSQAEQPLQPNWDERGDKAATLLGIEVAREQQMLERRRLVPTTVSLPAGW